MYDWNDADFIVAAQLCIIALQCRGIYPFTAMSRLFVSNSNVSLGLICMRWLINSFMVEVFFSKTILSVENDFLAPPSNFTVINTLTWD